MGSLSRPTSKNRPSRIVTSDTTATVDDYTLVCSGIGPVAVTLTVSLINGQEIRVINNTTNAVTINTSGTLVKFNGGTGLTDVVVSRYSALMFVLDTVTSTWFLS